MEIRLAGGGGIPPALPDAVSVPPLPHVPYFPVSVPVPLPSSSPARFPKHLLSHCNLLYTDLQKHFM